MCVRVSTCMHVCPCVCMCESVYACVRVYACVHMCACDHVRVPVSVCMYACVCPCVCVHVCLCVPMSTCVPVCAFVPEYMCICAYVCARKAPMSKHRATRSQLLFWAHGYEPAATSLVHGPSLLRHFHTVQRKSTRWCLCKQSAQPGGRVLPMNSGTPPGSEGGL